MPSATLFKCCLRLCCLRSKKEIEPADAAACASMAALADASLAVMYSACASSCLGVFFQGTSTQMKTNRISMWVDVIFGVSIRPANNTIWYSTCLHKFTLCLWQFQRLRVGDQRRCMGFNLEMNSKYANGPEYTDVSRCYDIRFKDIFVMCHDDVDMPVILHQVVLVDLVGKVYTNWMFLLVDSLGKLCTDCIFLDGFKFYERSKKEIEPADAVACASMAALVDASLAVTGVATWRHCTCLHKFTLYLWQFERLKVGDQRGCMGFNLEMNSKYANGPEYTDVSRCYDIRFKDIFFVCHNDVDMPVILHQVRH
ncbi:hypothetical protein Tco_1107005 [Tanacetum coccineum]